MAQTVHRLPGGQEIRVVQQLLAEEEDAEDDLPAFFFAAESLAASTGCKVWESASLLLAVLHARPQLVADRSVLELGSGTGLGGLACAVLGAGRVTLSDLASVVAYHTEPSMHANPALAERVSCLTLDWTDFRIETVPPCNVVIASDCVWLREYLDPFVNCLDAIMRRNSDCVAIIAQTERATEHSKTFASSKDLIGRLEARHYQLEVLESKEAMCVYRVTMKN